MSQSSPQLDYGKPPLVFQRRRTQRRLIWGAIALALVSALWWGPLAFNRCAALYWQKRCMEYVAHPDQIVFEEDPTHAAELLKLDHNLIGPATGRVVAMRPVPIWNKFSTHVEWAMPIDRTPILFLHARQFAGGTPQLLAVRLDRYAYETLSIAIDSPSNASLSRAPECRVGGNSFSIPPLAFKGNLRFYAGQPDPVDLSHFTIRYEIDGEPGIIEGWLTPKGPDIKIRDGPAKWP